MDFSLEQLEAFVAAAEEGSFSAAARRLGKVQSAVSNSISNLEISCGTELFVRSKRNPELTSEGKVLLKQTKVILMECGLLQERAKALTSGAEDSLVIALDEGTVPQSAMVGLLEEMQHQFPYTKVEVLTASCHDVATLVASGRAHLGVMFSEEGYPDGFLFEGIGNVQFARVISSGHPLAKINAVSSEELWRYQQLALGHREPVKPVRLRTISDMVWYIDGYQLLVDMVRQGIGWCSLPVHMVQPHLDNGSLVKLNLNFHSAQIVETVDLITNRSKSTGKAGQWLASKLRNLLRE